MQINHQHSQRKTFIIACTHFKGLCLPLDLQVEQFNGSQRPLLVNVSTELATQPRGILPYETPEHSLKTIKVLNLFCLPYRGGR